jgi:penicillin-binding protein 1A
VSLDRRVSILLEIIAGILAIVVVSALGLALYLMQLSTTLPDLSVDRHQLGVPETSVVYAADGTVLATWHGEQDRTIVKYGDMPQHLRDAVVAVEDKRFWQHNGVDAEGVLRALHVNAANGALRQGGSTITQQLIKVLFTGGKRTLSRKLREALLAYQLEARADKEQVLATYLNTVYFGNGAYGVQSAARRYFGVDTSSLDLAQSATLAGLIRSPSRYDPTEHPAEARARRDLVLAEMLDQGYITAKQASIAQRSPMRLAPPKEVSKLAPHFVDYVKQELIARLGEKAVYGGGLRVHTTLDPKLQALAEKAAKKLGDERDPEVAIVSLRFGDGRVVAMVGGHDYAANQFNLAVQGRRQPGSAFKPFVLVGALEEGIRPQDRFMATPYVVRVKDGVWNVQNYENAKTARSMTLQTATNWSVNGVYARLIMRITPDKVVDVAKRLGIVTPVNADPAIALGGLKNGVSPLEMASAYGSIATGGMRITPSGIAKVTDDEGKLLYRPDRTPVRAIDRAVAVESALMLHNVVEKGTGMEARIGKWAAGKTGTTQSYRDAWFVGWSGDLVTSVWVGYPQAQVAMTDVHGVRVTGGSYPARIWAAYMKPATTSRSRAVTPADQGQATAVRVRVCQDTMLLANSRCPRTVDIYLTPDLVPQTTCTVH